MDAISLIVLALALSLDSLMVGVLYGTRGIRIPTVAIAVVSLATGLLLWLAMNGGQLLASWLPPAVAGRVGAVLLMGTGAWITYQTWRTQPAVHTQPAEAVEPSLRKILRVQLGSAQIVIEILRHPSSADLDRSGHISMTEACFLGIALALDSVAAGLGASLAGFSPIGLPAAAALASFSLMYVGSWSSSLLPFRLEGPWAMAHGLVLVALGLYRMVA